MGRQLVFALFWTVSLSAHGQGSSFAKLDFGETIFIDIPRNWTYLDENLKRHLNTGGEAVARLAGITPNPGENVILVAANAFTSFRTPSATLRLSVRRGDGPSQADVREISRMSKAELSQFLAPIVEETQKTMIGVDGVKSANPLRASVVSNKSLSCMFFEFETETIDGTKVSQTYVCPMATNAVKLSTSYRKSEAAMFRPVTQYVWQSLNVASAAGSNWKQYPIAESGFTVALPSQPQSRLLPLPSRDGSLRVYEAIEPTTPPSKFSILVGQPEKQGIFEPASMDAYLSGHIKSMVATVENGKLQSSRRITFRGQPALEYQFSFRIEDRPYIGRGVTFMIDGGHIRVSMLHPTNDPKAEANFKRFLNSFRLTPIGYVAAETPFSDQRGITFSPPKGWVQEPTENAAQVARFHHLTRSIRLLAAGNPAYTCNTFQAEMQASGRLKSTSAVRLGDQQFTKLTTFEDVPKYNVRLLTIQYCINSRFGAVVLTGTEEESMFPRWAEVFQGTAASVRVR